MSAGLALYILASHHHLRWVRCAAVLVAAWSVVGVVGIVRVCLVWLESCVCVWCGWNRAWVGHVDVVVHVHVHTLLLLFGCFHGYLVSH